MKISAIAVISKNRALGKDNRLLFHVPGDLPRFKKITSGHPVIMGRKTFESKEINRKALPNRLNIVVTRDQGYNSEGVVFCKSINEAINKAKEKESSEIFIIGGGQIYKEAWPFINKLYLTAVDTEVEGDTYFPDYSDFLRVVFKEEHEAEGLRYTFLEMEK
jgi:dihydrofolate reductase